jgi:prevent-host-death family protein
MRPLKVSENVVSVSEFKSNASRHLDEANRTKSPVVITRNGKAAGVLLSPEVYDRLTERFRFLSAIEEGLDDIEEGNKRSHHEVSERLQSRTTREE